MFGSDKDEQEDRDGKGDTKMKMIKQGALTPILFQMISSVDHISAVTGATVTVTISKNGGAFAAHSGAVAELSVGWYKFTPSATDTNTVGTLALHATATSSDPSDWTIEVTAFDVTDAIRAGLTSLPNAVAGANLGLPLGDASARVAVQPGTGTGQLSLTAGVISSTVSDKTGFSLSTPGIQAIFDFATSALTTAGSIGKLFVDNLNAAISSRMATFSYTAPPNVGAIASEVRTNLATELGRLDVAVSTGVPVNADIAAAVRTNLTTELGRIDVATSTAVPVNADIASAVRTNLATELGRIDAAVSTAVPNNSNIAAAVRTNLTTELGRIDATVSSRLADEDYTAPGEGADSAAIATAVWGFSGGRTLTSLSALMSSITDAILNMDIIQRIAAKLAVYGATRVTGSTSKADTAAREDGGTLVSTATDDEVTVVNTPG